jgi:hypothetical protein
MFSSSSGGQSVFSSSIGSGGGGRSAFSGSGGGGGGKDTTTMKKFKKLTKTTKNLEPIFAAYQNGRYNQLTNLLTQNKYQRYSVQLRNLKERKSKFPEYEDLRGITTQSLQGVYKALQQFSDVRDLEQQIQNIQNAEDILYNPQLLHEYLQTLQPAQEVLPGANVTAIAATLRPEYAEYISLYGYPEDGIFDMDLLGNILKGSQTTIL